MQNAMTDRLYEPAAAPRREWGVTVLLVLAAHVAVLALPLLTPSLDRLPEHPLLATLVPGPEARPAPATAPPAATARSARPAGAPVTPLVAEPPVAVSATVPPAPAGNLPPAVPETSAAAAATQAEAAPATPMPSSVAAAAGAQPAGPPAARPVETDIDIVCPRQPAAVYPGLSQRLGETGRVLVRLELDLSGRIIASTILQSSGSARLDKAAQAAIARYQCRPALLEGRPVPATTTQQFDFVLK